MRATRGDEHPIEETVHRQGTAYRRARQLFAAGYEVTATQFSADEPPEPIASWRFDGIRFVRLSRL